MSATVKVAANQQQQQHHKRRPCSIRPPHLDILWLPRTAMRSVERDPSDCVLVVGVSRPKMALCILAVMLFSLFLTFHMIYDSAVHSLQQAAHAEKHRAPLLLLTRRLYPPPPQPPHHSPPPSINGPPPPLFSHHNATTSSSTTTTTSTDDISLTRRLPQAIIIGVRKCGTRALLEMLHLHPRVQKAAGEVHFFDRDDNYNRGLEWYRMRMPHSYAGQVTIEKSPSYFVTPEVPERIRAMNASVKLLLIVREPVTRAISDYTQLRAHATGTSFTPTAAAAAAAAAAAPTSAAAAAALAARSFEQLAIHPNGSINGAYRPLAISVYHHYVHRWLETFPREQLLVVNGDSLIEDPVPQLQRIEQFLGLEPRISAHNFYFNETKGFYCLRNETSDRCLRETKGRRHPRVNPMTVSKLRRYFGEHNQRFYELVGEDLGWPED